MKKPIRDWTLGELQKTCSEHPICRKCPLHVMSDGELICKTARVVKGQLVPERWNLEELETESLTSTERMLCDLMDAEYLSRDGGSGSAFVQMWHGCPRRHETSNRTVYFGPNAQNTTYLASLPAALFPSVPEGVVMEVP